MSNPRIADWCRRPLPPVGLVCLLFALGEAAGGAAQEPPPRPPTPGEVGEQIQEQPEEQLEERLEEEIDREVERRQEAIEDALEEVGRELRRDRRRRRATDTKVSIGSTVRLEEDRVAENVISIGGDIKIDGEVEGDAVAIMGSIKIDGRVTGDVVAVLGGVELGPDAEVLGDVTSVGRRVDREPGATVVGAVSEVAFAPDIDFSWGDLQPSWRYDHDWTPLHFFDFWSFLWAIIGLVMLVLLSSVILLVAPNAVSRVEAQVVSEPWKSGLVGLVIEILIIPVVGIVCLVLAISIIGIPLLLLLPFVLLPLLFVGSLLGYTGSALGVGRLVDRRFSLRQASPYIVLVFGVAVIQSLSLIADLLDLGGGFLWFFALMFGLFGFFLRYVAWTVGLGAVFLTRFGSVAARSLPMLPSLPRETRAEGSLEEEDGSPAEDDDEDD